MSKKVLVVPLNWGLGHATRMTAVARMLLELGASVTIAASGSARRVMEKELPQASFVTLSRFEMKYYRGLPAVLSVLLQLPFWYVSLSKDRRVFLKLLEHERFDLVISDNHFGCYTDQCPSIIVTHQIRILLPLYLSPFSWLVNLINRRSLNRFSECWVPDGAPLGGLSGRLAHDVALRIPVHYAGTLSRFERCRPCAVRWDVMLLLSGPEPKRTEFEQLLRDQIDRLAGKRILLVRGKAGQTNVIQKENDQLYVADYLTTEKLQEELCGSRLVVCRSGYSTLMDLHRCNTAAVLVPTPGQPEQEYLARRLKKLGCCFSLPQHRLNLPEALAAALQYRGWSILAVENRWPAFLAAKLFPPNPTTATAADAPLAQKTGA